MFHCLYNLNIGRPDTQFSVGILKCGHYLQESCWTERLCFGGAIYDAVGTDDMNLHEF